jgi:hypothetical protein
MKLSKKVSERCKAKISFSDQSALEEHGIYSHEDLAIHP